MSELRDPSPKAEPWLVTEPSDVVLPGVRRPMALGFKTEDIARVLAVGAEESL
jgi:hypothetical protein